MHTIPEALATSIAAARLITCTGSSVTSEPASPGTGDAGFFLVLAMNNHALPWKRNGEAARGTKRGNQNLIGAHVAAVPSPHDRPQRQTHIRARRLQDHSGDTGSTPIMAPKPPPHTSSAGNRAGHEHPAQCTLKNAAARAGGTGSTRARLPCRGTRPRPPQPAKDGRGAKFRGYLTPPRPVDSYALRARAHQRARPAGSSPCRPGRGAGIARRVGHPRSRAAGQAACSGMVPEHGPLFPRPDRPGQGSSALRPWDFRHRFPTAAAVP